ncbi:fimbrial protein [Aeromonas salmonicida]|uniref:fimbrial protein n=1 Tax=Aeromonas salmonicida TaxID=645 RepID=UPI002796AF16|nr:fimbrial protein [Aeromonas salmonicida]MDQ1884180.1 fimbrial protein [Aeromonas salmonicida]
MTADGVTESLYAVPFDIKAPSDGTSPQGDVAIWNEDSIKKMHCIGGEPNTILESEWFFKFTPADGREMISGPGGRQYINIDNYFSLAFEIFIGGRYQKYVPLDNSNGIIGNKLIEKIKFDNNGIAEDNSLGTGKKGRVFLWIRKPFIGIKDIPVVKVFDARAMVGDPNSGLDPMPYMSLFISGTVTSDASCQFTEQVYAIEYGDLSPASITSMSQLHNNKNGKQITLNVNCSNNVASLPMTISLVGSSVVSEPNVFSTSHSDIGIAVKANDKLVQPLQYMASIPNADQQIETKTNGTQKSATIQAYPIKLDDKVSPGEFKATATLKVDFK